MSWYRDSDGKIITNEEYRNDCMECECFCQEGMTNIPCNGERTDCSYFKEVDTSDYDKEIRNKAIDEFVKFEDYLMSKIKEEIVDVNIDFEWRKVVCLDDIGTKLRDGLREIAERLKETEEPFFNFDSPVVDVDKKVIRRFADWCYINGIDFSYMSTTKKSAKQFIDDVIERYSKEQMKEVGE